MQKKKNIFNDSSSDSSNEDQTINRKAKNHRTPASQQKFEVIEGVYLTNKQLYQIISKHGSSENPSGKKNMNQDEDRETIKQLKNKYIDLCNVLTEERKMFTEQMERQRSQFEIYKQN